MRKLQAVSALPAVLAVVCAVPLFPRSLVAQADLTSRSDRVVVHSPHFDEVTRPWGGLSCPAPPVHFFGFESPTNSEAEPVLRVRVMRNRAQESVPIEGDGLLESVVLALSPYTGTESSPPDPMDAAYGVLSDSLGAAEFSVPPGLYWLDVSYIGYGSGAGVISVRAGAADSLHVHLGVGAICEEDQEAGEDR